jgi:hypothetical protein
MYTIILLLLDMTARSSSQLAPLRTRTSIITQCIIYPIGTCIQVVSLSLPSTVCGALLLLAFSLGAEVRQ